MIRPIIGRVSYGEREVTEGGGRWLGASLFLENATAPGSN